MGFERDYEHEAAMRRQAEAVVGGEWRGEAPKAYKMGALHAIVSRDEVAPGDLRWHVSVSRRDRVPTWDEMAKTIHALRPGVMFVIPLPPKNLWVNIHENCLHAHEVKDEPLVEQWRHEGQVMRSLQTAGRQYN
jgi:hypothetical protein